MKSSLEVPEKLLRLYRHWGYHLEKHDYTAPQTVADIDDEKLEEVITFARKRMEAWIKRQDNVAPTSDDEIIARFRFCNIYRELDKQTIEFHKRLEPYRDDFAFWLLNMFVSRFIANTSTVNSLALLKVGIENSSELEKLKRMSSPKYGTAYIFPISTILKSPWPTREEFLCGYVPTVIGEFAEALRGQKGGTVNELLELLIPIYGFNHYFLWTEVLIDVHYQFPELVDLNRDFYVGPGSKPTMKYLKRAGSKVSESELLDKLAKDRRAVKGVNLLISGQPVLLTAENWEGIGCEARKYRNLSKGVGRRRLYRLE